MIHLPETPRKVLKKKKNIHTGETIQEYFECDILSISITKNQEKKNENSSPVVPLHMHKIIFQKSVNNNS